MLREQILDERDRLTTEDKIIWSTVPHDDLVNLKQDNLRMILEQCKMVTRKKE
jgi:hypothetical protein